MLVVGTVICESLPTNVRTERGERRDYNHPQLMVASTTWTTIRIGATVCANGTPFYIVFSEYYALIGDHATGYKSGDHAGDQPDGPWLIADIPHKSSREHILAQPGSSNLVNAYNSN